MLELATLGLLQREPLHGYRLKQQLELFMSSCISVNYGAIYPLLKRLEERGEIATLATEEGDAGPTRKIYGITPKGRQRWHHKMLENPHESWVNSRSRFMIKYFFFSHLAPAERVQLLEHRLRSCRLHLESVELENTQLLDSYESTTLERCISLTYSDINWFSEQLTREQKELYDSAKPAQTDEMFSQSQAW
jgi:DNA-binding PadR family transcriptional regulator